MKVDTAEPPRRVGPYRMTGVLGRGGMGVVYAAWHERLERPAALKRLLPELAATAEARARFLREARTAARLNHPSVVQIYDVLEADGGDWIVMERVQGDTLARRALERPLELGDALDLGRQVAAGLAAAHRLGLVHRDLKSENVMVTGDGGAKILDFGLARPLLDATTAGLTVEGRVLGTCRAMSPEQASGRRLDPRSDLFSFGTLLYETLTGTSPFLADSLPATLHRVCTHAPPRVRELNPDVPPRLSDLVDRLLEKDPVRRPQSASEVAGELEELGGRAAPGGGSDRGPTLPTPSPDSALYRVTVLETAAEDAAEEDAAPPPSAAAGRGGRPARVRRRWLVAALAVLTLVVALAAGIAGWPGAAPPAYVAVLEPEVTVSADGVDGDLLRAALRDGLLDGLFALRGVRPLSPAAGLRADRGAAAAETIPAVARAVAAERVLRSTMSCDAVRCDVRLESLNGSDGSLAWSETFRALTDRPDLLAAAAASHLRQALPRRTWTGGGGSYGAASVPPETYADFVRLTRALAAAPSGRVGALLVELRELRRREPRFLAPYLLEAEWLRYRFHEERERGGLDRAFDLLAAARRLAPDDPRPFEATAEVALKAGDLERAAEAVEELENRWPGSAETLTWRAELAEQRGDGRAALELLRDAVRLHPAWRRLHKLARLEIRQGEPEAARRTLERLLRRVPDSRPALSSLAQLELLYGDLETAAGLYRRLVAGSPDDLTVRNNLGVSLLLLGRWTAAEEHLRIAAEGQPRNPQAALNLADALAYQGHGAAAAELYRRVVELVGEPSVGEGTDGGPPHGAGSARGASAGEVWTLTVRAQALAHLGRRAQAVADVQEALRRAGDNPQVRYEAALTYSLVGDRSSALVNALAALEAGVQPRWFRLPGFDAVRAEPELRRALAAPG